MPTKLIEQGRYDEALQLENISNEAIKGSEMPITVLCLYKAVPENLEDRFLEYHDLIIKRSADISLFINAIIAVTTSITSTKPVTPSE